MTAETTKATPKTVSDPHLSCPVCQVIDKSTQWSPSDSHGKESLNDKAIKGGVGWDFIKSGFEVERENS